MDGTIGAYGYYGNNDVIIKTPKGAFIIMCTKDIKKVPVRVLY